MYKKLKILFVSAEVAPFAKTGGLADVAGSLPVELTKTGHDVRIIMPRYKAITQEADYCIDYPVKTGLRQETCIVRKATLQDTKVYFIDNYHYYDREGIYCYYDDGERFAFFCMAVLEFIKVINFKPDIIHCNDWHTGPICMLLKEKYTDDNFYSGIKTIFSIHNLRYQGLFNRDILDFFGVSNEIFIPEKVEFYGNFNFLKAGLIYADKISTVSRRYAKEILTPEYGERLEGVLNKRKKDLYGIVNGIDYSDFNPGTDKELKRNFTPSNFKDKYINRRFLQKEMNLPVKDVPVIGVVHRLTDQKGLDLILETLSRILSQDVYFVLLGQGNPYYEKRFKEFMADYPKQVSVRIEFNTALAKRIYAGADMFLMPSSFEPCGLGQMISLRYGTIPIVRLVGGLADTVVDVDENPHEGNGFAFREYDANEFLKTVNRALKMYRSHPIKWEKLVLRAMMTDFSWKHPAKEYIELYKIALQ